MRNYKNSSVLHSGMENISDAEKLLELRKLKGSSKNRRFLSKDELSAVLLREYGVE
jgi:hypothetical protein